MCCACLIISVSVSAKLWKYVEALIFRFRFSPFPFQNVINSVFYRFRFQFCVPLMYFPSHTHTHTHTLSLSLSLSLSQTAGLKLNKCAARQSVPNPATDTVTGHARGCACEQACPKLESMWIRKYGFPLPSVSKHFIFFYICSLMYTTTFLMNTEIK